MTFAEDSRRAVFLDVDGTYADHGVVPPAHVEAVRELRTNGHYALLCTGRPACAVSPLLTAAGFDGIVSSAGARVDIGGDIITSTLFPQEVTRRAVEVLESHGATYALEAPQAMYASAAVEQLLDTLAPGPAATKERHQAWEVFRGALVVSDALGEHDCAKIFVFNSGGLMADVVAEIGPEVSVVAGSNESLGERTGEIHLTHITKAVGMEAARVALGVRPENVVAAGDGPNDLEMLAAAATAIVVEGALPELMAHADVVARPPRDNGLVSAFRELGLI